MEKDIGSILSDACYNDIINCKEDKNHEIRKPVISCKKKSGFSQEAVAEKLGVSRQTISKWETDETVPDIYQSKKMAKLYQMTLDELIEFDVELDEIQEIIDRTDEKAADSIDWTSAWGKKYPILVQYQAEVNVPNYAHQLNLMLEDFKQEYHYNEQDAFLVLKDILYQVWKNRKGKNGSGS